MEHPTLITPGLEAVYLVPVETAPSLAVPILDENGQVLRDEDGLPIYEE